MAFFCVDLDCGILLEMFVVFEPFKDARTDILLPKLLFIAMNFAALGLGLYKLNSLGLLPTHASDWVSSLPPPQVLIGCIFDKFTC
jgi:hypothetical protein